MQISPQSDEGYVSVTFDDDGGAAKDDDRRFKRKIRSLAYPVFFFVGCIIILYFCLGGQNKRKPLKLVMNKSQHLNERNAEEIEYRWNDPRNLPPIPGEEGEDLLGKTIAFDTRKELSRKRLQDRMKGRQKAHNLEVRHRADEPPMEWETEADDIINGKHGGPVIDYTQHAYDYPDLSSSPSSINNKGQQYPPLEKLSDIYERWPQDEIDNPPTPFVEKLLHFDYLNPMEMEEAIKLRDVELPFKVYNVPEIDAATLKWTDEYVASNFIS
eukprot:14798779-Ditylum_brightwellii.AAC.1